MASSPSTTRQRLDSWKQIAAFFDRDERTVNRWEKERGLPVHRLPGTKGRVYAYVDELSRWLDASEGAAGVETVASAGTTEDPRTGTPDEGKLTNSGLRTQIFQPASDLGSGTNSRRVHLPVKLKLKTLGLFAMGIAAVMSLLIALPYRSHDGRGAAIPLRVAQRSTKSAAASPSGVVMASTPAHDPEAEQLYLKGRYYWNKRTPEDLNTALDFFMQAVVRDPNYAKAYMGMADCYNLLREYTMMPPSEAYPRALAAAKKAVELDDESSGAHASLAFALFFGNWNVAAGEREFRRAIDLDPNNATAHHWYASALSTVRQMPESLAEINRAQVLDPSSTSILADKGHILILAGQQREGVALLKQMEATEPLFLSPHRYLQDVYLVTGDSVNFLAESRKVATLVHDDPELTVTVAAEKGFVVGGTAGMLQGLLQAQKRLYRQGHIRPSALAQTCALMGDREQALQYLNAAYEQHEDAAFAVESYAAFDSLHNELAYHDLVSRLNLPGEN